MLHPLASVILVLGLVGLLVVSFGAVAKAGPVGPASFRAQPLAQPWASNNTGGVAVVFDSPFPEVSLVQNANASIVAGLQVDGILELAADASAHPRVVAVALPLSISHFNGTPPGNRPAPWTFNLTATLEVYPTALGLWNGTPASPPTPLGPPFGQATLTVGYTAESENGGTGEVAIAWSVSGWPWSPGGNVLALESHFSMSPSAELWTCAGSSSLTQSACAGQEVALGSGPSILWKSGLVGIEEDNSTGPTAAVGWSPTLALSGQVSGAAQVTSGLDVVAPGSVEFVLAGIAAGANAVSGTMSLSLFAESTPPSGLLPMGPVTASPLLYLGSAAVFAVLAASGVWWYRRRAARARDEL